MTVGRSFRGSRAAVFAAVCVALSAAGHVWMSRRDMLSAWWLWRGETAAFALIRWISAFAVPLLIARWADPAPAPADCGTRRSRPPADTGFPAPALLLLSAAVIRRGPPHLRYSTYGLLGL